jgi:hypothetical protein
VTIDNQELMPECQQVSAGLVAQFDGFLVRSTPMIEVLRTLRRAQ